MLLIKQLKSIGIGVLVIISLWLYLSQLASKEVGMAVVRRGTVQNCIELPGTVEVAQKETVFSKHQGSVVGLPVSEGVWVKAYQQLLQIKLDDFKNSLTKTEMAYEAAKARVAKLSAEVNTEPVKLAQNQLEQAKATEDLARERLAKISDQLHQTKLSLDAGKASATEVSNWQERLQIAGRALAETVRQTNLAKRNLALIKKAMIPRALVEAEQEERALALEVEQLRKSGGQAVAYAGIAGRVTKNYVTVGSRVKQGDRLMELENSQTAFIQCGLAEADYLKVRVGQKVLIGGPALKGNLIEGMVGYRAPLATGGPDASGGSKSPYQVRVKYDTAQNILRTGEAVNLRFIIKEADGVLVIPRRAVVNRFGRLHVFVEEAGRAFLRPVETGVGDAAHIEIKKGLFIGEKVIIDPELDLRPGMKVIDGGKH